MAVRVLRAVGLSLIMQALCAIVASASCTGADPNDWSPDDDALQACIDAGGTLYLDPGSPGYIVNRGLILRTNNVVITSSGAPGTRATIMAGQDLDAYIITTNGPVNGFTISYISFQGMVHDNTPWRLHRDECVAGTIVNNSMSNPRGTWSGPNCQLGPLDYAAWHFGSATIQDGWTPVEQDGNTCIINP